MQRKWSHTRLPEKHPMSSQYFRQTYTPMSVYVLLRRIVKLHKWWTGIVPSILPYELRLGSMTKCTHSMSWKYETATTRGTATFNVYTVTIWYILCRRNLLTTNNCKLIWDKALSATALKSSLKLSITLVEITFMMTFHRAIASISM